jgi:hypothetical protein
VQKYPGRAEGLQEENGKERDDGGATCNCTFVRADGRQAARFNGGLDPDKRNEWRVPEALSKLIATHRLWVHSIGGMFDAALEHWQELTRHVYKLPERGIYDGLDANIVEMQERPGGATGGAMGIGRPDDEDKGKVREYTTRGAFANDRPDFPQHYRFAA